MFIMPHTLSLITTHQCTAACDHCCFHCTPKITKAIPYPRLCSLIDEAASIKSMRVVVFTGGECFLLGKKLDSLIQRATSHGLVTRCVTNGYWASSIGPAIDRVSKLKRAGLKEINFSTGTFHARFVPVGRIVNGARASVEAGLITLVNIEICDQSDFDMDSFLTHPDIKDIITSGGLVVQRNVWMENQGETPLTHQPEQLRFRQERRMGCSTVLDVLAVTPDQSLVACCGLHLEKIPELHLGSVAEQNISDLVKRTPDDFLKIWIHVEGPERILEFVKEHSPDYCLPINSEHPCQTCLHLYEDSHAREIIREYYHEVEGPVMEKYIAELAIRTIDSTVQRPIETV